MKRRNFIGQACLALILSACGTKKISKFKRYRGLKVTTITISKSSRRLRLYHNNKILRSFHINLGANPIGHKQYEGDARTPEGVYVINRINPNSKFHLSLGISYPNSNDIRHARKNSRHPGSDIFIHGGAVLARNKNKKDWTNGCISVPNSDIEEIYAMVKVGTPILIKP